MPTEDMVESVAMFLTLGPPFGATTAQLRASFGKVTRSAPQYSIEERFRSALATIIETAPKVGQDRISRSKTPPAGLMSIPNLVDPVDHRREMLTPLDDLLRLLEAAKALQETFKPFPVAAPRKRHADWHVTGLTLAGMIDSALRNAGRKKVALTKADAPAVRILVWALGVYGYHVTPDAAAKYFARRNSAHRLTRSQRGTTPPS